MIQRLNADGLGIKMDQCLLCAKTRATFWVTGNQPGSGSGAGGSLSHKISSINSNPSSAIQCVYLSLGAVFNVTGHV